MPGSEWLFVGQKTEAASIDRLAKELKDYNPPVEKQRKMPISLKFEFGEGMRHCKGHMRVFRVGTDLARNQVEAVRGEQLELVI